MDFNEYWKNGCFGEYHDIYAKTLAEQFYQAGQQSKQAEIDALREMVKKLIDNTVLSIDDELEDQANNLLKGIQR